MKVPLLISGNFGDIRANAYHFGLDFRTRPGTGFPVYAIADGFVSRIKIEPGGYGRVVYVEHPNGSTSAYAHLESLAKPLHDFVINEQYKKESFNQDILFTPNQLPMKKGDLIGISGNAGLSSGPHLHFEIRDTKTQSPTNPFRPYWGMIDKLPPIMRNLWVYEYLPYNSGEAYFKKQYKINGGHGSFHLEKDKPVSLPANAFIGLDLFDHLTDSARRLSFYNLRLFVDNKLYYELTLDTLRFDQMNQVNTIVDYNYKQYRKSNIYTLIKWPNQDTKNIKNVTNNGIIVPQKGKIYTILIEATDISGNKSSLKFQAELDEKYEMHQEPSSKDNLVTWESGKELKFKSATIVIPEKALFYNTYIKLEESLFKGKLLSNPVVVGSTGVPLKKPIRISYDISNFPEALRSKLVVVSVSGLKNVTSLGGTLDRNILEATSRWFGAFALQADTIAPGIRLMNISANRNMSREQAIKIKISDELSGVSDYKALIDGKWALFEYDAKSNTIIHKFDRERFTYTGNKHTFELTVSDKRGNSSKVSLNFIK